MAETMYVRPADGLMVRGPSGDPLPAEGAQVPRVSWWLQCLRDGDVVAAEPPAASE